MKLWRILIVSAVHSLFAMTILMYVYISGPIARRIETSAMEMKMGDYQMSLHSIAPFAMLGQSLAEIVLSILSAQGDAANFDPQESTRWHLRQQGDWFMSVPKLQANRYAFHRGKAEYEEGSCLSLLRARQWLSLVNKMGESTEAQFFERKVVKEIEAKC